MQASCSRQDETVRAGIVLPSGNDSVPHDATVLGVFVLQHKLIRVKVRVRIGVMLFR